jgi:5-formyltetrahydrofolate cyclo-ligase
VNFDGPALDALKVRAKKQLRSRARALRGAIPRRALKVRSDAVVARLEALEPALLPSPLRSVALFWPMEDKGEVDLRAFDASCRARGLAVYYPFFGETLESSGFARVDRVSELEERGRGFAEPDESAPRAEPGEVDLIVVPALAVCESGHRLGYGAGFYDGVLPRFRPPAKTIVVAYDFELLSELPTSDHDVACDLVVTDQRTLVPRV